MITEFPLSVVAHSSTISAIVVGYMSTTNMANPCDICGDKGVIEAIITCCECKTSRQHLYCMRVVTTEAPQFWLCEECERKKLFSPTPTKTTDKEQIPEVLIQKNTRVLKSPNKSGFASRFNFKEKRVNTGRTKYISCEEAVKLSSGVNKSEQQPPSRNAFSSKHGSSRSMPPPREKSLVKIYGATNSKFEPQLQQPILQKSPGVKDSIKSTKCSSVRVERTNTESFSPRSEVLPPTKEEADIRKHIELPKSSKNIEKTITQEITKMAKSEVLPPTKEEADIEVPESSKKVEKTNMETGGNKNHADVEARNSGELYLTMGEPGPVSEMHDTSIPALHSYWKGSFNLPNGHEIFNGAFRAHPPSNVHSKVYETLNKMPENICFELVPISEVWVDLFQGDCPYKDDIGLYFFPRYKKRYEKCTLTDFLWNNNLVMKSYVDEVELLVLSSKFLQLNSQEFEGNYFLWGVFRANMVKKDTSSKSIIVHENANSQSKFDDFPPMQKPPPQG